MITFPLSERLHELSAARRAAHKPYVIAVGGSVAVGKSTFARGLADAIATWPENPVVVGMATDGFLFPNAVLAQRGISMRKGFPESYDVGAMRAALSAIRDGARVEVPRYSHVAYDVDLDNPQIVERPDILILDGLHLAQVERVGESHLIDSLIYLDAPEQLIESWFTARLLPLMIAGRDDPKSFYFAFRDMSDGDRRTFAERVWREINLPNLRDHIVEDREAADFALTKAADHTIGRIVER
jgi:type I pantothenate kinase